MFFLILTSTMSAIGLYVALRLVWPLSIDVWLRLALCVAVLVCANKVMLMRWLAPGGVSLKLPFEVLVGTAWVHISVVLMCGVGLSLDFLGLVLRKAGVQVFTPATRLGFVALVACVLAGVGIWNAIKAPQVDEVRVPVRHLPPELQGLRIALLADLHIGPLFGPDWVREVVRLTNAQNPDLVAIAGDVVDDTPTQLAVSVAPLRELRSRYGTYVIVGNHEYYAGLEPWKRAYPNLGMHLLFNEHAVIEVGTARLVIAGLTDRVTLHGYPGERPDLDKALQGAPGPDEKTVRLVLDHQPAGAADNARRGMDVQFSGHTHGGLALPIQKVVAHFNGGFVSGQYAVGGMQLVVTNGTGLWAGMPLRLGVPGQIVMVTLVAAE